MNNMYLIYHNDKKEKNSSHSIGIKEDDMFYDTESGVFSHDILNARGYGETKEEALENLKKQIIYLMKEYEAFAKLLLETDVLENSMVDVDCFGKPIKSGELISTL